jgi:ABC-type lipoprotein release transport system permease subunit
VAAGVSRSLAGFLFGVTTFDLLTFVTVAVFLMLMTTVACAIPARRAAKIDPLTALKC